MKCKTTRITPFVAVFAATLGVAPIARAQETPAPPASAVGAPQTRAVPPLRLAAVPAQMAAAQITQATGVTVLTDSTVGLVPVTFSTGGGDVESVLQQIIKVLPKGAAVRTILLPAFSPKAALPSGDDVISLYGTQEKLVAPVMGAKAATNPDGAASVNVLGKLLSREQAAPIIAALDLRPVYVLTNAQAGDNLVAQSSKLQAEGLRLWMAMTPDQRAQAAEQQFDSLMNMDSATRQAMFGQAMQSAQAIGNKINSMSPEQKAAFFSEIKNALPAPPPGAGAGESPKTP